MEIRKTRPVSLFLSTPSARRATEEYMRIRMGQFISIHALREEGDTPSKEDLVEAGNFYPRPPRGGRLRVPSTM